MWKLGLSIAPIPLYPNIILKNCRKTNETLWLLFNTTFNVAIYAYEKKKPLQLTTFITRAEKYPEWNIKKKLLSNVVVSEDM